METFRKQTRNRRTVVIMAVITILGYAVWVATYQPTALDRLRGNDYYGASACQVLIDWLDESQERSPAFRLYEVGQEAAWATTPSIKDTSGLIENDDRFVAYRGEVEKKLKEYGYSRGRDYADDLVSLDAACAAQGIDMPTYHKLI